MLCKNCGKPQPEHYGVFMRCSDNDWSDMRFAAAGRIGHEQAGLPSGDMSKYVQNPHDTVTTEQFSKPVFVTGMSVLKSNPKFHAALKQMAEMHDRKSADYADTQNGNFYTNFEEAAATAGTSVEEVFLTLIGVKLARLRELKKKGTAPQNESVQDSRKDLAIYAALYFSYFVD